MNLGARLVLLVAGASVASIGEPTRALVSQVQPHTQRELYLIASLTYQSSAAEAALRRQSNTQFVQLRSQIDSKDAALKLAYGTARKSQTDAVRLRAAREALERDLTALKGRFAAELAAKDAEFARERANLEAAANDLLKTSEGQRALEVYLSKEPGSAEAAVAIAQRVAAKRNASDKRAIATAFGMDGLAHGRFTTPFVIKLWEDVLAADPGTHQDWVELSRLYRDMNRLADAKAAAERSISTASDERDRAAGLNELGDILVVRNDLTGALANYRESLDIAHKLAGLDPSCTTKQRDLFVNFSKVGNMLVARNDLPGALDSYREGLDIARNLARLDPSSADAQRDILLSLVKLAEIRATGYRWSMAKDQINVMQSNGQIRPADNVGIATVLRNAADEARVGGQ